MHCDPLSLQLFFGCILFRRNLLFQEHLLSGIENLSFYRKYYCIASKLQTNFRSLPIFITMNRTLNYNFYLEDCKCFQFHGWTDHMINDCKWDFLRLSDESRDKNDDKWVWMADKLFAHIRCWIRYCCLQKKDEFLGLLLTVKFRESNNLRNSSFLCKYANISAGPVLLQIKNTSRYLRTYRWLISEWASRSLFLVMNYCANIKKVCGDLKIPTATENTNYKMFPFSS